MKLTLYCHKTSLLYKYSKWTISNIQTGKYENWRALGSVGISIDRISYKTAADTPERNGLYMADVTITLEAI